MKRTLALGAAVTGITILLGAPVASAAPDPSAGCVGQVTSDLAQYGSNVEADFRGLAGLAKLSEDARGELNAIIRGLCNGQPPPPPPA